MLYITIPGFECFDDDNNRFITIKEQVLNLEHSLVSISRWESKWKKPFISKEPRTIEESIDYIKCMTTNQIVNPIVYTMLTDSILAKVNEYINHPMTATTLPKETPTGKGDVVTSELIYYWMIAYNIPSEYQKWHLNRLLVLIKICNIKNSPSKKMSRSELLARNKQINAQRRESLNTKG